MTLNSALTFHRHTMDKLAESLMSLPRTIVLTLALLVALAGTGLFGGDNQNSTTQKCARSTAQQGQCTGCTMQD